MVRYSLRCADGHAFESWFASAAAYDDLAGRGLLSCADCGGARIEKALMAPAVATAGLPPGPPPGPPVARTPPRDKREAALAELRRKVEAESTYVGPRFAAEARAIHEGAAPERSIYGEASGAEARALMEDGIPVAPLPFLPTRKAN